MLSSDWYCTVHWRWVHTTDRARNFPLARRIRIAGLFANGKILALFGASSSSFAAMTALCVDSASAGGMMNRMTAHFKGITLYINHCR